MSLPIFQDDYTVDTMAKSATPQDLSPIQNDILSKLKNALSLRYSELNTRRISNDLFNYHLQFLVKKGYVTKSGTKYTLASTGLKHLADPIILNSRKEVMSLFKSNVLTIVARKNKNKIEILNQQRTSHPSFGKIGVMGGIVQKGETTEAAAARKLETETGLKAKFRIIGIERRMLYKDGELFSDLFFPIAYTDSCKGELKNTEYGKNMWVSIDQAIKNESDPKDSIQSLISVLRAIKKNSLKRFPFFYTETSQHQ